MTMFLCPVRNMIQGDRFMTNRRGMVTVAESPRPSVDGGDTYTVLVTPDDNGESYTLVGLRVYRVERV